MTPYLRAPEHVIACDLGPATVIVDYQTGRVRSLTGPAASWWSELARSGDLSTSKSLETVAAVRLAARLAQARMLLPGDRPQPWRQPIPGRPWRPSWGTHELDYGFLESPDVPKHHLGLAAGALAITLATRALGPREQAMSRLVRLVHRVSSPGRIPAGREEAETAVHAVRRVGLTLPTRVACLEESVAAVLVLAFLGRRGVWCHGVAGDPVELHAWLQTEEGEPVAEPASTGRFRALLSIPDTKTRNDFS